MARLAVLALLLAACDVGSVLPEGGTVGEAPDASVGGNGNGNGSGSGSGSGSGAGTASLSVTFTTSPNGGPYAPSNVVAVWVEDAGGAFVKTIGRWSNVRTTSLVAWTNKSGTDADAVTGATRTNHNNPLTVTWDLKNKQNAVVPDGTYTIRMETADSNATAAGQNNQGTFTFAKGTAPQNQPGLTNGGFSAVTIDFVP